jgi:hypothetical protein
MEHMFSIELKLIIKNFINQNPIQVAIAIRI